MTWILFSKKDLQQKNPSKTTAKNTLVSCNLCPVTCTCCTYIIHNAQNGKIKNIYCWKDEYRIISSIAYFYQGTVQIRERELELIQFFLFIRKRLRSTFIYFSSSMESVRNCEMGGAQEGAEAAYIRGSRTTREWARGRTTHAESSAFPSLLAPIGWKRCAGCNLSFDRWHLPREAWNLSASSE